jgi:2-keto-4-pentenoate hydratase/2-oxohepta-3-ene-1,7-dioic acid hydratase in catechol pathway
MGVCWNRLIRFVTPDGRILRGEPILPHDDFDLGTTTSEIGLQAKVIEGNDIYDNTGATSVTDEIVQVDKLLGPLAQDDVDIIRCVGLNYAKHSKSGNSVEIHIEYTEPLTSHHSQRSRAHTTAVSLHFLQAKHLYCRSWRGRCHSQNRSRRSSRLRRRTLHCHWQALEYVAAYTCGNDISSRKLQRDPSLAGNVPQWGFSKGFDNFAPLGPCLVRPGLIGDPKALLLKTVVDGETRQQEYVGDLLFDCAYLISYLSTGTTLRKGSVIMTGTPGGK